MRGSADVGRGALQQRLAGDGGQRSEFRGLPHHGVATHQRDGGVPGPDGDGKIERGDDADDPERVPVLHEPVSGPLGGDGSPVELARETDRELADVDHLLHLAECLGGDLAGLDGHQRAQIGLVLDEQFAQTGHECAPDRCRCGAPGGKCLCRLGDRGVGFLGAALREREQHLAGDGRAGMQAMGTGLTQCDVSTDGL
ncbi:Uncharacterised protein [Mycobacteroides abscessus subsp. abscessus]|nr:Uncharacterised protein [Mycobacteroides abscessus subsp. abscessus]